MPSGSFHSLLEQLEPVDQLVAIHKKVQSGAGRRHQQDALHKAGVVMSVAAWQAYIEKLIVEVLDVIEAGIRQPHATPPAPPWALHSFNLRRSAIETELKKFNTPNSTNVRDILDRSFGFKPWPSWVWRAGKRNWNEQDTRQRTNDWVRVRHTIAHGYPLPTDMDFLKGDNGAPRLTLGLLNECQKHFKHVARKTDDALRDYLVDSYGIASPW